MMEGGEWPCTKRKGGGVEAPPVLYTYLGGHGKHQIRVHTCRLLPDKNLQVTGKGNYEPVMRKGWCTSSEPVVLKSFAPQ